MLDSLDEYQKQVVNFSNDSSIIVIAPPGSGKTKVITARIFVLLTRDKVPPEKILALSYTRKGAEELRSRLIYHIPEVASRLTGRTIHSFCNRLLGPSAPPDIISLATGLPAPLQLIPPRAAWQLLRDASLGPTRRGEATFRDVVGAWKAWRQQVIEDHVLSTTHCEGRHAAQPPHAGDTQFWHEGVPLSPPPSLLPDPPHTRKYPQMKHQPAGEAQGSRSEFCIGAPSHPTTPLHAYVRHLRAVGGLEIWALVVAGTALLRLILASRVIIRYMRRGTGAEVPHPVQGALGQWRERGRALGLGPDEVDALMHRAALLPQPFTHILIDEAQDLLPDQIGLLRIILHLVPSHPHTPTGDPRRPSRSGQAVRLFAVGDPCQTIFQFLGASRSAVDLLAEMAGRVGPVTRLSLVRNYRCHETITGAARHFAASVMGVRLGHGESDQARCVVGAPASPPRAPTVTGAPVLAPHPPASSWASSCAGSGAAGRTGGTSHIMRRDLHKSLALMCAPHGVGPPVVAVACPSDAVEVALVAAAAARLASTPWGPGHGIPSVAIVARLTATTRAVCEALRAVDVVPMSPACRAGRRQRTHAGRSVGPGAVPHPVPLSRAVASAVHQRLVALMRLAVALPHWGCGVCGQEGTAPHSVGFGPGVGRDVDVALGDALELVLGRDGARVCRELDHWVAAVRNTTSGTHLPPPSDPEWCLRLCSTKGVAPGQDAHGTSCPMIRTGQGDAAGPDPVKMLRLLPQRPTSVAVAVVVALAGWPPAPLPPTVGHFASSRQQRLPRRIVTGTDSVLHRVARCVELALGRQVEHAGPDPRRLGLTPEVPKGTTGRLVWHLFLEFSEELGRYAASQCGTRDGLGGWGPTKAKGEHVPTDPWDGAMARTGCVVDTDVVADQPISRPHPHVLIRCVQGLLARAEAMDAREGVSPMSDGLCPVVQAQARLGDLLDDLAMEDWEVACVREGGGDGPDCGTESEEDWIPEGSGGKSDAPHVVVSTIHGVKGGEWDVVFIVGAEDHITDTPELFYVALTRARHRVVVSFAEDPDAPGESLFLLRTYGAHCRDPDGSRSRFVPDEGRPSVRSRFVTAIQGWATHLTCPDFLRGTPTVGGVTPAQAVRLLVRLCEPVPEGRLGPLESQTR